MDKLYKNWDDYIDWEEYYMSLAVLASKRSKDPDFRVGACIVNDSNQIVGIGYNGMPLLYESKTPTQGTSGSAERKNNDEAFPWEKIKKVDRNNEAHQKWLAALTEEDLLKNKHLYVCHAELNAIAYKTSIDVKDCTMYVTLFPCNECAKLITQSKIKKVVYLSDEKKNDIAFVAGRKILETVGVDLVQYKPSKPIKIDMEEMLNQAIDQAKKRKPTQ